MKTAILGAVILLATLAGMAVRSNHLAGEYAAQRDSALATCDSLRAAKVSVVEVLRTRYTFVDAIDSNLTFDTWDEARAYAGPRLVNMRTLTWSLRTRCCPCCR